MPNLPALLVALGLAAALLLAAGCEGHNSDNLFFAAPRTAHRAG